MDLEELPDSRERKGAPVLCLSCEGQIDVCELFSDNSYLNAILDRQGLLVAVPVDLRTEKAESFSPQLLQGFWSKLKKKTLKIVVMSPNVTTKTLNKKISYGNGTVCPWPWQNIKSSAASTFLFLDQGQEDLVVENWTIPSEKVPLPMDTLARQETQLDFS